MTYTVRGLGHPPTFRDAAHGHLDHTRIQSSRRLQKLQLGPLENNQFYPLNRVRGEGPHSNCLASKIIKPKARVYAMTRCTRRVKIQNKMQQQQLPQLFLKMGPTCLEETRKRKLLTRSLQNGWLKKKNQSWLQPIWSMDSLTHFIE